MLVDDRLDIPLYHAAGRVLDQFLFGREFELHVLTFAVPASSQLNILFRGKQCMDPEFEPEYTLVFGHLGNVRALFPDNVGAIPER